MTKSQRIEKIAAEAYEVGRSALDKKIRVKVKLWKDLPSDYKIAWRAVAEWHLDEMRKDAK